MQIKKMLNSKESKEIEQLIKNNYGCEFRIRDYVVIISADEKIWLCSRDLAKIELKNIKRVNSIGLYFGKIKRNNKIQLSIEGSMLLGKNATKNIAEIDDINGYVAGKDVYCKCENCEENNFVIVRHKNDFFGCGVLRENGKIENILPKSRRMILNEDRNK
ncbi:MAG: hypothetical protein N3D75_00240 [Candidatus Aenigmarchaeota archaeon]|nr:hypothetical protein [Candidatus Aenigmarchaeota archaeon]